MNPDGTSPRVRELLPYYRIQYAPLTLPSDGTERQGTLPETLLIEPGVGFGDGRHETTQLCLLALGYLLRSQVAPTRVLDFGAGNGILGIAAARHGAKVECVEIDEIALAEAQRNVALNHLESQFEFRTHLSEGSEHFELVVANILLSVLLEFTDALASRLATDGTLILSGLTATCVPSLLARYRTALPNHHPSVFERGAWRAVLFFPPRV